MSRRLRCWTRRRGTPLKAPPSKTGARSTKTQSHTIHLVVPARAEAVVNIVKAATSTETSSRMRISISTIQASTPRTAARIKANSKGRRHTTNRQKTFTELNRNGVRPTGRSSTSSDNRTNRTLRNNRRKQINLGTPRKKRNGLVGTPARKKSSTRSTFTAAQMKTSKTTTVDLLQIQMTKSGMTRIPSSISSNMANQSQRKRKFIKNTNRRRTQTSTGPTEGSMLGQTCSATTRGSLSSCEWATTRSRSENIKHSTHLARTCSSASSRASRSRQGMRLTKAWIGRQWPTRTSWRWSRYGESCSCSLSFLEPIK